MSKESYFIDKLLAAKQQGVAVSVYYAEDDPDTCTTGYVENATADAVTLRHLKPDGAPDGEIIVALHAIFMIDVNGRYERMVAFLGKHHNELYPPGN